MKFCATHWTKLRDAMEARGLTPLISDSGASVVAKMVEASKTGGGTIENFDPLMFAHNKIVSFALDAVGLVLLVDDGTGEKCPICYLTSEHAKRCVDPVCTVKDFEFCIERAADDSKTCVDRMLAAQKES